MRYGSIPAGGLGTRLQPLGFSKELAPVAGRAVIEYLLERLVYAGIDKIFVNLAEDKLDLARYLATKSPYSKNLIYTILPREGLMEGILAAGDFLSQNDELYFGLPDTIWYPLSGFKQLAAQSGKLVLGLFDTGTPHLFDSVVTGPQARIRSVKVKVAHPESKWTWGIGKVRVSELATLRSLAKPLFGETMHAYSQSHLAYAIALSDSSYLDIGVKDDYRRADEFVSQHEIR